MGGARDLRDDARTGRGDGVDSVEIEDMARGVGRGAGDWSDERGIVEFLLVPRPTLICRQFRLAR